MADVFQRYGDYYDLLYRDKDYAAEADYVAGVLRVASPDVRSVLEFGSGTGRHGRLLAARQFDVLGIDRSTPMLAAARDLRVASTAPSGRFECLEGDITALELRRTFDAVIALFHVVSYQTTNAEVQGTFASAARHLRPGGVFMFDVWHGPAVLSERPSVRIKRVEDGETRLIRIAEPSLDSTASVVTVRYTLLAETHGNGGLATFAEEHRMRYFFPTEIGLFARQAGFTVQRAEEFLTGRPPTDATWGVAYVLRHEAPASA